MKKIIIGILCLFTLFSISGCSKTTTTSNKTNATHITRSTVELLESDLENQMCNIAEFLTSATFTVLNYDDEEDDNATSLGSGVVYKRLINDNNSYTYYLVTNRHVVSGGEKFKVLDSEGSSISTNLLGVSEKHDIAVLTFTSYQLFNVVSFAYIDDVRQGQYCFAMGTPIYLQYMNTFTKGNVSGIRSEYIQHTADINAGNSGGPLVNLNGELIGINVSKLSNNIPGQPDIDGMCQAIRCDLVEDAIDEIEGQDNAVVNPIIGLSVLNVSTITVFDYPTFDDFWNALKDEFVASLVNAGYSEAYAKAKFNDLYEDAKDSYENKYIMYHAYNTYIADGITKGMFIKNVVENSPSDVAGVMIGDVVTKINDKEINSQSDFAVELYKHAIGDSFTITINRSGEIKTLTIQL